MERLNKIPIIVLGAINGILLGVLLETVCRSIYLYEYSRSLPPPSGWSISYPDYPFSWYFFPLLLFFVVTSATFLVHRCTVNRIKSPIWFWQITGIVSVFFFSLYLVFYTFYAWYCFGLEFLDENSLKSLIKEHLFTLLISFPIAAAFNLLFTFVLKSFKTRLP